MHRHKVVLALLALAAADARADDWPMWGGSPGRNMVSSAKNLPAAWDGASGKNVLWTADLGDTTYGNPVVADGRVFIGTNNGRPRDPDAKGDLGVLMCFSAKDGSFLWQAVHEKLPEGNAQDWEKIGICSTPAVVGDRIYYVSNRAELVCADTRGFADEENDGPYTGETRKNKHDADIVWILDMRAALGVVPFQASSSSPLVVGDRVFVMTGQGTKGRAEGSSFIAVERKTGKVAWKDASPGGRIIAGQWGSPAYGVVEGRAQVVFPGGDGRLYALDPATGKPLWTFNCKAHEKKDEENHLLATPVFSGHRVLIATGRDPHLGESPGCLRAVNARGSGDVTATGELWRLEGDAFGCSISTVAVHDGRVYAAEMPGFLSCVDLATGRRLWRHDLLSAIWSSPLVADGKVYLGNEDGEMVVFQAGDEAKVVQANPMPRSIFGTAAAAGGVLYFADANRLYALTRKD